jgi:hypothetical protein
LGDGYSERYVAEKAGRLVCMSQDDIDADPGSWPKRESYISEDIAKIDVEIAKVDEASSPWSKKKLQAQEAVQKWRKEHPLECDGNDVRYISLVSALNYADEMLIRARNRERELRWQRYHLTDLLKQVQAQMEMRGIKSAKTKAK